jgi:hypothetical protein
VIHGSRGPQSVAVFFYFHKVGNGRSIAFSCIDSDMARRSRCNKRGNNEECKTVCLPAEFKALLNMRRPAPAKGPHRGCPPATRGLYRAAVKTTDSAALQNLEELKQTSAEHKLICYAIHAHLTDLHPWMRGGRLAA